MESLSNAPDGKQASFTKTLRLVIFGRVQGVFFRDSMRQEALRLGVSGWVRNRSDGSVEAAIHGEPTSIDAIVRWVQHGPPHAQVVGVEIEPHQGHYTSFDITA